MQNPGGYAIVLDCTIVDAKHTCKFSRVLIDGGSSINILYRDSMTKLGIKAKQLEPSKEQSRTAWAQSWANQMVGACKVLSKIRCRALCNLPSSLTQPGQLRQ